MLRQRDHNSLSFCAILVLIVLFSLGLPSCGAHAEEGWRLWLDDQDMGVVPVKEQSGLVLVPIGSMARLLEFDLYPKDETLIIKNGTDRVQIVQNAAAVWFNVQLIPLAYAARFEQDRWWVDSRSAIKILSFLVNAREGGHRLAWAGEGTVGSEHETVPITEETGVGQETLFKENKVIQPQSSEKKDLSQLRSVRWGKHDDRIRVVLDLEGESAPEILNKNGVIEVHFARSPSLNSSKIESPYPKYVRTGITYFGTGLTLSFHHSSAQVSSFNLEDPLRVVIDFSSGPSMKVLEPEGSGKPELPAQTPVSLPSSPVPATKKLVVVDPGHGGKDPGAVANGVREKDINLKISRSLVEELKKRGIPARMTRENDSYLRLSERTDLANKWNASVFISIHANALPPGRHATGMEIYLMALPTDKDAMQLALIENKELGNGNHTVAEASDKKTKMLLNILGNMQQNAKIDESTTVAEVLFAQGKKQGLSMRRVAQAPFFVLRGAGMPAVLVETGFITERREAKLLSSPSYQNKLALSLAEGIAVYLDQI